MNKRINIQQSAAQAYSLLIAIETFLHKGLLSQAELDLVKIRVSQINGCAYCLDMHTKSARKNGETEQRIYVLPAWRETSYFSVKERAMLALAEEITLISKQVSDKVYESALNEFGEEGTAQLIVAIVMINSWNRIAISTRLEPGT